MSIIDHLPARETVPSPQPETFTNEQLVAYETRRQNLVKAIDLCDTTRLHPRHHTASRQLVSRRAHDLIEHIATYDILTGLTLPTAAAESEPLSLADVYLLVYAADASCDSVTWDALGEIFDQMRPHYSDDLADAYYRAGAPGKMMAIYRSIVEDQDTALDHALLHLDTTQKPAASAGTAAWGGIQALDD